MKETNAIIEILVMGVITLLGVILFVIGFLKIDVENITKILISLKDYANILLLIVMALSYQLGWLVNKISHYGLPNIYYWFLKNSIFDNNSDNYQKIRDTVYLKASDSAIEKIKERLSSIRLLRSGTFNMLILIVGVTSIEQYTFLFLLVPLFLIFSIATFSAYKVYITGINNTYNALHA